ncbi:NADP-dependent oxidoreductase domain-containing protein [Aspergillus cavernicola]|uniref:D-xylose reductase [NAD(P)H] n=1 Tax=Aspergillus cavernicola TaxID=176166 RepID=A0ABR4J441_9EURO
MPPTTSHRTPRPDYGHSQIQCMGQREAIKGRCPLLHQPVSQQRRSYKIALIGLGYRGYRSHFLSLTDSPSVSVVAVCDTNQNTLRSFSEKHSNTPAYSSLARLLDSHKLDFAVISLPHGGHFDCVTALSDKGVPILKEKPVAESVHEYAWMRDLPMPIGVTFQKRFEPQFLQLKGLLPLIGDVTAVQASLALNIAHLDETWRATTSVGVTEDLGCHMLDLVVWLFGLPTSLMANSVSSVRPLQQYSGDDVSNVIMDWGPKNCMSHVHMSRVAHRPVQSIAVTGTKGTLLADGCQVMHYDIEGRQLNKTVHQCIEKDVIRRMTQEFGDWATGRTDTFSSGLENVQDTVLVVDAIKDSLTSRQVQHPLFLSTKSPRIPSSSPLVKASLGRGSSYSTSACSMKKGMVFPLNTGSTIPSVGLGTRRAEWAGQVREAVRTALQAGYRHIDTAESSGNEYEIGQAIKDSGVPRNEIWVTTKLDNRWHGRVAQALETSLSTLDTGYVDLYLMHWPICVDPDDMTRQLPNWSFIETWKELEKLSRNKVRNIGVSNFGISHLEMMRHACCDIVPAVNQIELHPYWPSAKLLKYCAEHGIHCTAYSPLGSYNSPLLREPMLHRISQKTGRTKHQILLKWGIQRGTSVIPRSVNPSRIQDNFGLEGWKLTNGEMGRLNSLITRLKSCGDDWLAGKVFLGDDE